MKHTAEHIAQAQQQDHAHLVETLKEKIIFENGVPFISVKVLAGLQAVKTWNLVRRCKHSRLSQNFMAENVVVTPMVMKSGKPSKYFKDYYVTLPAALALKLVSPHWNGYANRERCNLVLELLVKVLAQGYANGDRCAVELAKLREYVSEKDIEIRDLHIQVNTLLKAMEALKISKSDKKLITSLTEKLMPVFDEAERIKKVANEKVQDAAMAERESKEAKQQLASMRKKMRVLKEQCDKLRKDNEQLITTLEDESRIEDYPTRMYNNAEACIHAMTWNLFKPTLNNFPDTSTETDTSVGDYFSMCYMTCFEFYQQACEMGYEEGDQVEYCTAVKDGSRILKPMPKLNAARNNQPERKKDTPDKKKGKTKRTGKSSKPASDKMSGFTVQTGFDKKKIGSKKTPIRPQDVRNKHVSQSCK